MIPIRHSSVVVVMGQTTTTKLYPTWWWLRSSSLPLQLQHYIQCWNNNNNNNTNNIRNSSSSSTSITSIRKDDSQLTPTTHPNIHFPYTSPTTTNTNSSSSILFGELISRFSSIIPSSSSSSSNILLLYQHHISHPQYQQIRWKGRNDGNRYAQHNITASTSSSTKYTTRKSIKKQQKKYHRKLQKHQLQTTGKHNPPGSRAALQRQYRHRQEQEILQTDFSTDPNTTKQLQQQKFEQLESSPYDSTDALLDDMMGNVHQMTPTPQPSYIGHLQTFYYNQVVDQMEDYHSSSSHSQNDTSKLLPSLPLQQISSSTSTTTTTTSPKVGELPTDEMISKALRAYRDRHGTRHTRPIGIVSALQHLLYDMQIPIAAMGEYTYTTLLTCCRTPTEGRRILQMIREQGLPVSAYSYSILCHIYAKLGDYQGCINVQQEMLQDHISPTLPSYTSLLAACYKICNNGRVPHSERTKAAQMGWEKWQEMRIIGIEPDVMAYGAILRLKAASGKAEECINLLNEMIRFEIYPTTLCYTTALRAVARSHAIAIRYEKGISQRNRRREMITTYHGKLARQIVILAESANIVKDEGFMSALCLCAGEAGDIATVKAIYIAHEILTTQHDHLRTIGSNEHLQRLQGVYTTNHHNNNHSSDTTNTSPNNQRTFLQLEKNQTSSSYSSSMMEPQKQMVHAAGNGSEIFHPYEEPIIGSETPSTASTTTKPQQRRNNSQRYIPTFGEREYGPDNRLLSSVIHACAQAVHPNMMGTIWQGRENLGYLCINSLRLIAQPKLPQYTDNSIPGQTITDNLKFVREERDDGYREGKRQPRKFAGVDIDENVASTFDDILGDKDLSRRYINPDGRRKFEYRNFTPDEVWRLKYGDDWDKDTNETTTTDNALVANTKSIAASSSFNNDDSIDQSEDEINSYLDSFSESEDTKHNDNDDYSVNETNVTISTETSPSQHKIQPENKGGDIYFDYETMRWKPKSEPTNVSPTTLNVETIKNPTPTVVDGAVETSTSKTEEELYFDTDIMRWKTRPKIRPDPQSASKSTTGTVVAPNVVDASHEELDPDNEDELSDNDEEDWESASDDSDEDEDYVFDKKKQEWVVRSQPQEEVSTSTNKEVQDTDENFETEIYYDDLAQEWKTKPLNSTSISQSDVSANTEEGVQGTSENFEEELYYNEKDQEWKTKSSDVTSEATKIIEQSDSKSKKFIATIVESKEDIVIPEAAPATEVIDQAAENEKAFQIFYSDLRKESLESEQEDVTEEEARELFDLMKDEYNEMIVMTPEELGLENHPIVVEQRTQTIPKDEPSASDVVQENGEPIPHSFNEEENRSDLVAPLPFEKSLTATRNSDTLAAVDATRAVESLSSPQQADTAIEKFWNDTSYGTTTQTITLDPSYDDHSYDQNVDDFESTVTVAQDKFDEGAYQSPSLSASNEGPLEPSSLDVDSKQGFEMFNTEDFEQDYQIERLRELLPHFSERRLVKIIECYQRSMGDPSILELIPIVRENMPDYITSTWLKQMSTLTAKFAIQKAAQNELVNAEILNSVLELHTASGSLDRAIEFHQTEFAAQNLEPTEYSDRLVVQMLLRNNRFNRALAFKQTVENSGRSLDIKSYGSLVEFCARRKQLGSAILLLKECLSTHGAPPGEASLSNLRLLCRQAGVEDEIGLESIIGKDPVEWLRHGERELKREYSKKGRRNVQLGRNALVRL